MRTVFALAAILLALPALAQDRTFGETNLDARIVLKATGETWVRVRDDADKVVFMRTMRTGDTFMVPNRAGLVLDTGNGRNLDIAVDGKPASTLVQEGGSIVRRDIALDTLTSGAPAAPRIERAALSPPARPATPAGIATNIIATAEQPIRLEIAKGSLIRLRQPAGTVFVADPEVADVQAKSAALLYVYGKKAGETVVYAVDEQERVLLATRVVVSHNLSGLRQSLKAMMPDAAIEVASVDNSLILSGFALSAAQAENARRLAARFAPEEGAVVNQIQVSAPNQISLRVRIAEVSRTTLKELGINWDSLLSVGSFAFGIATGSAAVTAGQFVTRNASVLGNGTTNSVFGGFNGQRLDVNGVIDALATEGLISVLAEPNLTALSGETASFLAGGEFPVPIPQSGTNITIEFKKFGVGLAFTPTLMDGDRINLHVRPEVSQLSTVGAVQLNNFSIPALTTRRAETTVELGSGQSFAIAGLLQNNTQQDNSKIPFLGDVPVLGPLFRSDRFKRNETELVILVTPYIVRPASGKPLAAPTDGMVPPNDVERLVVGSNYRQQAAPGAARPRGRDGLELIGPAGFVLE